MPKISLSYQQHRQIIGNHIKWQDRNQKSQKYQDNYIRHLAQTPGRHTDNIHRQDIAYATLQLIAILSVIRNCNLNPVIGSKHPNELNTINQSLNTELCYGSVIGTPMQQNAINRSNYLLVEKQQKKLLRLC